MGVAMLDDLFSIWSVYLLPFLVSLYCLVYLLNFVFNFKYRVPNTCKFNTMCYVYICHVNSTQSCKAEMRKLYHPFLAVLYRLNNYYVNA